EGGFDALVARGQETRELALEVHGVRPRLNHRAKLAVLVLECSVGGRLPLQRRQGPEPRVRLTQNAQSAADANNSDHHHDREGDEKLGADRDGYPRHETSQPVGGPKLHALVLLHSWVSPVIGCETERLAHHCHISAMSRLSVSSIPSSTKRSRVGAATLLSAWLNHEDHPDVGSTSP